MDPSSTPPRATSAPNLIACHDCDLLIEETPVEPRHTARCPRCGAALFEDKPGGTSRALAYTIAAAVFFVLANVFPFMTFKLEGREQPSTIASCSRVLWEDGMIGLAFLVLFVTIIAPAARLGGFLYVLLPLSIDRVPWKVARSWRSIEMMKPWGMLEVYMLGVLVSIVKLMGMATIELGVAFWSFCVLLVLSMAASVAFDPREVWRRLEPRSC